MHHGLLGMLAATPPLSFLGSTCHLPSLISAPLTARGKGPWRSFAMTPSSRSPFYTCLGGNASHFRGGVGARSEERRGQQIPPVSLRSGVGMTKGLVGAGKQSGAACAAPLQSQKQRARAPALHDLYVPSLQPAKYSSWSGVSRSILIPMDSSFSLATRLSRSSGTR